MASAAPPRLHLLPARSAPIVVILRRGPSRLVHVIRWDTRTDDLTPGSWFRGRLFPLRCDVSWDGGWMIYLAMGSGGDSWNGICRPPWLRTIAEGGNFGTWRGGGYFPSRRLLRLNAWELAGEPAELLPFEVEPYRSRDAEDLGVIHLRMARDGWRRAGAWGAMHRVRAGKLTVVCEGDAGWAFRPSPRHPTLRAFYRGYLARGHTFAFALDEHPDLLGAPVEWATWDAAGNLLVARQGGVERYTLVDLQRGTPGFVASLIDLAPPPRAQRIEPSAAPRPKIPPATAHWQPPPLTTGRGRKPVLYCADQDEWEDWLDDHHEGASGVWLRIARRDTDINSIASEAALETALCYGWAGDETKPLDDEYFLALFVPRRPRRRWSEKEAALARILLGSGRVKPAGLAAMRQARIPGIK